MTIFELNGKSVEVVGEHAHLLGALRDELGILSAKDGCSPSGQCGCCTVIMDGKARISCQLSVERAEGSSIQTLEGIDPEEIDRMGQTFAACGALQCGFCTPGIMVRTKVLVDKKGEKLEREYAARHLGAHLCRCTGYIKILDAVECLAKGELPDLGEETGIGASQIKYEAEDLAIGRRPFIDDLEDEGLLHGAFKLSDHARAEIISIDVAKAEAHQGVVRVITAADVPGELKVGLIHKDWPVFIPVGGRTSYLGDVIAMVVAETREIARSAAELIDVSYSELPPITNPIEAIRSEENAVWGLDGNILSTSTYQRGDVDAAWAECTHVVSETFQTQRVDHAFLEPESTLATFDTEQKLYIYSGGQGIWDDRNDIARVLGIDQKELTVELVSNGGAFGGKEDMSNQAQTALAAWLLQKPVKTTLSREESFLIHTKRHPIRLEYKAGCDKEGKLKALSVQMVGDSGPYASVGMKVLERAAGHASGPYVIPNIEVEAVAARTNNSVCGAFRGFGANQAQFAMEGVMDRLAEMAGISGWEIRNRNVITSGSTWGPGQIMDDGALGARACLEAIKPAYDQAILAGRAVGVGLGLKNSGLGNGFKEIAKAVIRFTENGRVQVRHCWTEMGQGVHTVALQVAAEELGVSPELIDVLVDTSRELGAGQTTGSRGTLMGAGAVQDACLKAIEGGRKIGIDYEGEYRVDWTNSLAENVANPIIHSTFGYAAQLVIIDPASGKIERVVAAHDVGKAVNPLLCEGQIEGAVHMGLGYALTEGFPCDEVGRPKNLTLKSLNIIRPKDMPDVDVILVESPEPNSPYGIKGVGEIGLVPTAGAVAAALQAHDGLWRNELPMENISNRERAEAWS
ncbi:MAG TPA: molybdopterin cofactor-binding domain-containing protein [Acidimicrobiales bacterium]|nr:molybdopterin cofactor-binding domain-containing protein [Acidimicrobiales bacterium]